MFKHHEDTIKNITEKLKMRDDVQGILIGGSIAHGFETESSDVDIMILISDSEYKERFKTGAMSYWEDESCTYKEGYIDGKYICLDFMNKVADFGSEPARFAFDGSIIIFSKVDGLQELLNRITKYPSEKKSENIKRFYAQLEAWKWYYYEAVKHKNDYLLNLSVSNIVLFGGRMVLALNEILYPYHKWFLKVIERAKSKPDNILQLIDNVLKSKDNESVEAFYKSIIDLTNWDVAEFDWVSQFVIDSELNWMNGKVPVADI